MKGVKKHMLNKGYLREAQKTNTEEAKNLVFGNFQADQLQIIFQKRREKIASWNYRQERKKNWKKLKDSGVEIETDCVWKDKTENAWLGLPTLSH